MEIQVKECEGSVVSWGKLARPVCSDSSQHIPLSSDKGAVSGILGGHFSHGNSMPCQRSRAIGGKRSSLAVFSNSFILKCSRCHSLGQHVLNLVTRQMSRGSYTLSIQPPVF